MWRRLVVSLLIVGLGACGVMESIEQLPPGTSLQKAKRTVPETDEHGERLYNGYVELSQAEYDEGDYRDSDFFAERAIAAAQGETVEPQSIFARDLSADALNEAAIARSRLSMGRYQGFVQRFPVEMAEAQLGLDCWLQEMEEGFQPDDIEACRVRYEAAFDQIEEKVRLGQMMSEVVPELQPGAERRLVFDVFFEFDSDGLSELTESYLEVVVRMIGALDSPIVAVIGNADQSGSTDYNVDLSQRRAEAVAAFLRARGVELAGVFARGDQVPAVDMPDRAPELFNRRVIITVREPV